MSYKNQHILVLGLGESGLAMAKWLARNGAQLRVADSRDNPPGLEQLRQISPSIELVCGAFSNALLEGIDCLALSPGLSVDEPLVLAAQEKKIPVIGEIEIFARALDQLGWRPRQKIIAITGTNGKTTTTTLAGELCRAAGLDTAVAGNISPAALQELMVRLDENRIPDVWVLELSSFQLETTRSLSVDAATVLNVTDDHLDRHGSMAHYAQIKSNIFAQCDAQILNRHDAWTLEMKHAACRVFSFGLNAPTQPNEYGMAQQDGKIWLAMMGDQGMQWLMPREQLRLAGDHNVANALAALALCQSIGLDRAKMLDALKAFKGLAHRVQWVGARAEGIDFYDDSKGTNVGATLAALQGLGRKVVLIAGGDGKGQDFAPLTPAVKEHARALILIGKDAKRIEEETREAGVQVIHVTDLADGVRRANELACAGDAVLLSPACSSLDMFRNYAHRAEVFIDAVKALPGVSLA